ncbi:TonB-dependent receptor plug domain-containing protein [Williamwhitmania taraxaci]|uniref:Outer membrane receptor for ferrienterochelin and colicins n=1 Tax=Williamwhitmania taraxaci TaxID=1640674 RepID=A0A1G6J9N8_9BACT|nr:TonB-dependent receptor plug domain-containing protein [Williamwhitmania taraxaci]SDC15494.1 Outer membrane receptor for ferrienterochelin and colicins [Williamwhitmania taraxaci]
MSRLIFFAGFLLSLSSVFVVGSANAQSDTTLLEGSRFFDLTLEQLMNVQVDVATRSSENIREAAGVVTVVTNAEMLKAGTRDLKEVLSTFVPGMDFGIDVEGVVGVGFRGIWGNEGKVLLLVDGLEVNEDLFATLQWGNHYPVDMIERVEVIRGPGSAIYGGYAGLAVINVITKASGQGNGSYGAFLNSYSKDAATHRNMSFGHTQELGPVKFSFAGTEGEGTRATRTWIDAQGVPVKLSDKSEIRVSNYNAFVQYKGLSVRGMIDLYRLSTATLWGQSFGGNNYKQKFDSYFGDVRYTYSVNSRLKIIPSVQIKQQYPWQLEVPTSSYKNRRYSNKVAFDVNMVYDLRENSRLMVGGQTSQCRILGDASDLIVDKSDFSIINYAGYGQLTYSTNWANFTIGCRFDSYNHYGSSFVPRLSITKAWSDFSFKAMASQSFRVPGGVIPKRNMALGIATDPEKATNYELEIGYRFGKHIWFTVNGYRVVFDKVIVYTSDPVSGFGNYSNGGTQGTYGTEADFRITYDYVDFRLNYAYYVPDGNETGSYTIPNHDEVYPALANHRLNAIMGFKVSKKISVTPSLSWYSERYGFNVNSSSPQKFGAQALVNVSVSFTSVLVDGLDFYCGAHNITDRNVALIQPYNGGHPAIPSESASVFARLVFNF